MADTRSSRSLIVRVDASCGVPGRAASSVSPPQRHRANGMSDEMYRDVQPSPGRGSVTSMPRSTLAGLVLLLSIGAGPQALAQDAPRSDVPPAVLTAPSTSAPPAVLSAVNNKPTSATIPAGNSRESTRPTARRIGSLPSELSPWSMFLNADMVVKMSQLASPFASVVTWTIWLAKGLELVWAKRPARAATHKLRHAKSHADGSTRGPVRMDAKAALSQILVDEAINEDAPLGRPVR